MLPLEFVVVGTPLSHQSHNKTRLRAWQQSVRRAAEAVVPQGAVPVQTECLLLAVYFFGASPALLDNDNFIKPIQDALIGLIYEDDRQVTDTIIRRTFIGGRFRILNHSRVLIDAIEQEEEFVYIRIEEAPDHTEIP
jgi:crossover junction endodeoxyribonuclease RusA